MRVMHVAADLGTYGAERFVAQLLDRLREPDIELAALTTAPARPGDVREGVTRFSAARSGRYDVTFLARMAAAMRAWRPHVVHTHTHAGKYWGRLAALAAGVPAIVHTEHNSEFGAPAPFRVLNALLLRRTDALVTFSAAQCERLVAEEHADPARIALIPNGIAIPPRDADARERGRALLGATGDVRVVLHVGRLSAVKNQALAIEALARLPEDVRLAVAGEGRDRAALERLARERGVAGRATLLGYRTDATALIAGADALLVTSRNEAMPLTVIEAMLAGTPVVSTPWLGASEMLGAGAYGSVVPDYAAASVAAALLGVLDDPDGSRERAERAAAFARVEYDIGTAARRHADLYRAISARMRSASRVITAPRS
jgi:glycosyltransferase involved in cell wall biosynthesis